MAKVRGPVQRDAKEVMAELVAKLKERLEPNRGQASSGPEPYGVLRPNLSGLTVGVDLGDKWSSYCVVGLEGETLTEGQLKTTQEDVAAFFSGVDTSTRGDGSGDTFGLGPGGSSTVRA